MNVLGTQATMSFGSEPDIAAWAAEVPLNPAGVPAGRSVELTDALDRLRTHVHPGLAGLRRLGKV
jgi:hypothetical protein